MTNVLPTRGEKAATWSPPRFLGVVALVVLLNMPTNVRAQDVQVEIPLDDFRRSQIFLVPIDEEAEAEAEEKPAGENQEKKQEVKVKADRNADAKGRGDEKKKDDKKSKPIEPPRFLRILINGEISFIKRVAKPTDEQMDEIIDRAKAMLQEVADDIVQPANKAVRRRHGELLIYGPSGERLTENPFDRIPAEFTKILEPILQKDQFRQYQKEAEQREKVERELTVKAALRSLDHKVVLTQSQYDELYELLLEKWEEVDLGAVTVYTRSNRMVPSIPKDLTDQVLNERQKPVWKDAPNGTIYLRLSNNVLSQLDEEWIQ